MRIPSGKEGEMGAQPTPAQEKAAKSSLTVGKRRVTEQPSRGGWLAKLFGPKATWVGSKTK